MNARQERLPSPVKQHILWTSPLKGMERPVRSFKSFIRSVPPNPSPHSEKPLPPTPTTPDSSIPTPTPLPPASESSEVVSAANSWKVPAEWESNQASPSRHSFPTFSLFSARDYSPLLPELSPGVDDRSAGSGAWPGETSVFSRPQLDHLQPIQERARDRPSIPPRHPSRPSPFTITSVESDPGMMSASIEYPQSRPPPGNSATAIFPEFSSNTYLQDTEPRSSAFSHRISDASTKARAFASLGIGSPRDNETPWENWANRPGTPQKEEDDELENLTTHSKKTRPHHQGQTRIDSSLEDDELTQKLQQLSFAQDYHKVLTQQYHESDGRGQNHLLASANESKHPTSPQSNASPHDHELFPPPLTWNKDSRDPSPVSSSSNLTQTTNAVTKPRRRHKRIVSWVQTPTNQHRNRHSADREVSERSANEPTISPRKQGPISEVDKLLMKDIRLPNLLAHTKRLRSPRGHTRPDKTKNTDQAPVHPAILSPSPEKPSSVLRLPGGFAIVRQPSSESPRSQTVSTHDVSVLPETPGKGSHPSSHRSSPVSASHTPHGSQQRFSQHSQQFQAPVAPTMAVKRLHDSTGSASSPLSRSNNSTPPTSPLAHEVPLPRTPPPIPVSPSRPPNPPRISSPLSYEHEAARMKHTDEGEHKTPVHKMRDKAKGARDVWRKRQQDLKHEKLKQSIRVLGPTDPTVTAGYVKREGRRPGGQNVDSNRMPGYMVTGPV